LGVLEVFAVTDMTAQILLEGKNLASAPISQVEHSLLDLEKTAKGAAASLEHLGAAASATAGHHTLLGNAASGAVGKHDDLGGAIKRTSAQASAASTVFQGLASGMIAGFGMAASTAAMNAVGNAFRELTDGVIGGAGRIQQAVANIGSIKPDINTDMVFGKLNEISTRVPQTAKQLGDGLYDIFSSLDVSTEDGLALVEKFAKGAVGASTDAQTFGTAAMGVMNAYGLTVKDADHVSDVFFNTVKVGVVTGRELAENLGLVTQSAKMAGVGLDDLGGFIAGVTKEGGPAAQNINNLNNLFLKLNTPQAAAEFKNLGIQMVDATGKLRPVIDVMSDLKLKTDDMVNSERLAAIQKIFPDLQAQAGAQVILDQLAFVKKAIEENKSTAGSAEAAFTTMNATFESQLKILGNTFASVETTIGATFLPTLTPIIQSMAAELPSALHSAGDALGGFANNLRDNASEALQGLGTRLAEAGRQWAPWAANAGTAGQVVSSAMVGTSGAVEALQFLLQGNFRAAWKDASAAMGDFGSAADGVKTIVEENRTLILSVGAAFGAWMILSTVVPVVIAFGSAILGMAAALAAADGAAGVLGVIVGILGGPVTIAIVAVAAAIGLLTFAWVNNFGDIQGKTESVAKAVGEAFDQFGTDLKAAGDAAGGFRDAVNEAFDPINDNINHKTERWTKTISDWWTATNTQSEVDGRKLQDTINGIFDPYNEKFNVWVESWTGPLKSGWQTMVDDATRELGKLGAAVDTALKPVTDALGRLGEFIHKTLSDAGAALATEWNKDSYSTTGGRGGIPGSTGGGNAASLRPSTFTDPQLTAEEAMAACGPAAVVAFGRANGGRVPTLREAMTLAESPPIGLNPSDALGMRGPANEQRLLSAYGMNSNLNLTPTTADIQGGAASGEILSTLKHYFTISGFDSSSGKYDVGTSGTDLIGGAAKMTLTEITNLMGSVNGLITDIRGTETAGSGQGLHEAASTRGFSPFDETFKKYAGDLADDPQFLATVAAGAKAESGFDTKSVQPGGKGGRGLFQMDVIGGEGVGKTTEQLFSADYQSSVMVPKYADAYRKARLAHPDWTGDQLAAEVAANAERPEGWDTPGSASRERYAKAYRDVTGQGTTARPLTATAAESVAAPSVEAKSATPQDVSTTKEAKAIAKSFDKLIEDTTAGLAKIDVKEFKDFAAADRKLGAGGTDTVKAQQDAANKIAGMEEQRRIADSVSQRKAALAAEIEQDTMANTAKVAAQELIYKRGLEDQAVTHSRQMEDANILVNAKLAADALVHQRQLQDDQIVHQERLAQEATVHQRQLQDQQNKAADELANIALIHSRQLQDEQVGPQQGLAAQATIHSRQLQDAEIIFQAKKAQERDAAAFAKSMADATSEQQRASLVQAHAKTLDNVALNAQYAAEELAHQRQLQDAENSYQQGLAAAALVTQRGLQDAEIRYQNEQKAQQVVDQRRLADVESTYQMGLRASEAVYQRGLQDTEIQYQQGIAVAALKRQRAMQDEERVYNRGLEDQAAAHALQLAADARAFTRAEKAKQDALDKTLADEAFERQKAQVGIDLADRIKAIAAEYEVRKQAILDEAKASREAFKVTQDAKFKDMMEAATETLSKFGAASEPVISKMKTDWAAVDSAISTATADITGNQKLIQTASSETGKAIGLSAQEISASFGITDKAIEEFADKNKVSWDDARAQMNAAAEQAAKQLGAGGEIPSDYGITDAAVEEFARINKVSWDDARAQMTAAAEQARLQLGSGGAIPRDYGITDRAVEDFAHIHKTTWDDARTQLNDAAAHAASTLGSDGSIPKAAAQTSSAFIATGKSADTIKPAIQQLQDAAKDLADKGFDPATTAADDLAAAIGAIKDRTITVTTNYISTGSQNASGAAGASPGAQPGSRSTGGEAAGGPAPNASSGSGSLPSGNDPASIAARDAYRSSHPDEIVGRNADGSIYAEKRAEGGPVVAGQPYWVGEKGPEPFFPTTNGIIFPHETVVASQLLSRTAVDLSAVGRPDAAAATSGPGGVDLSVTASALSQIGQEIRAFARIVRDLIGSALARTPTAPAAPAAPAAPGTPATARPGAPAAAPAVPLPATALPPIRAVVTADVAETEARLTHLRDTFNAVPRLVEIAVKVDAATVDGALQMVDAQFRALPRTLPVIVRAETSEATAAVASVTEAFRTLPRTLPVDVMLSGATEAASTVKALSDQFKTAPPTAPAPDRLTLPAPRATQPAATTVDHLPTPPAPQPTGAAAIDYERLARALGPILIEAMQSTQLSVAVDDVHSALLRKARRGTLGFS
jgi:TP901 family phage tail tape measure protein